MLVYLNGQTKIRIEGFKFNISFRQFIEYGRRIWLKEEIKVHYKNLNNINYKLYYLHSRLNLLLHHCEFDCLDLKVRDFVFYQSSLIYNNLCKKLNDLRFLQSHHHQQYIFPSQPSLHNVNYNFHAKFINLSNFTFSNNEENILKSGLKYNLPVNIQSKHVEFLAVNVEKVINSVEIPEANIVRTEIFTKLKRILGNYTFNKNFDSIYKTCKNLRSKIKLNNLVVTKADKGNCVVVLNKVDYVDKVLDFLSNDDFNLLSKDPNPSFLSIFKSSLKKYSITLSSLGKPNKFYFQIMNPSTPLLYGLPKLHKPGIPIRPVVSFPNSPVSKLAPWLNSIIRTHTNFNNKYAITNSCDLVQKIINIPFPSSSILVSFDVVNLFPSIPPDECTNLIRNLLFSNNSLYTYQILDLCSLLDLVFKQNYFKFDNNYYSQVSGLAMGSNISPLAAEIFMNNLENTIFSNSSILNKISFWYRYVDDCLVLFNGTIDELNNFSRKFKTRLNEHLYLINRYLNTNIYNTNSAFANHILCSGHSFSSDLNIKILHVCNKGSLLNSLETLEINRISNNNSINCLNEMLNLNPSILLSSKL
ncbi:hypothetical protein RN001_003280 [Aquatica leii]|uniref:Reverse transcriptase domain-containing protein n=1 Tax=Aquatica leii TaxID=1421715 RepID=A0AAN7SM80_9COLE|nr:hypothetical protein RN001_003280 [Aquatica leii]